MRDAETWRLFVAIAIPEEIKARIEETQAELRRALPEDCVRWAKRGQFHLTLKFLGDVEASRLEALTDALRLACGKFSALPLRARGIGFFPDRRVPRVIWAGVQDPDGRLPVVQSAVELAVGGFTGEHREETFAVHVTLGRVQGIRRAQAERMAELAAATADRFFGAWTADTIEVIRSELLAGGARYTVLSVIPLAGESAPGTPRH